MRLVQSGLLTAGIFAMTTLPLSAQDITADCTRLFSAQPITIVAPAAPGGGYDTYARAFAPALEAAVGTDVSVVNMPAGGGRLALLQVGTQEEDELLILIEDMGDLVALVDGSEDLGVRSDDFAVLGTVVTEPTVWMGRDGLDLADLSVDSLVAGDTSVEGSAVDIGLAALAMGIDVRVVSGYEGSGDLASAVLRQEVDFVVPSLGTALSNSASSDLAILLILSDEPTARAPNAPVLGGGDGLAARRAEGLDPDEAARRQELADAVVALTMSHRSLLTAASVGPERIACLRAAADIALADARFADAAEAEGRLVEPTFSGQAMTRFEAIRAAQANAATMLDGVLDSLAD